MYHIILAEDDCQLNELITDYLTAKGFEITATDNGYDVIELFEQKHFDLVLLDVMMPDMDGFETCKYIREKSSVPIIFMTAKVKEQDQLKGYELGCDDYVLKPFPLSVLYAKCMAVIGRTSNFMVSDYIESGQVRLQISTKRVEVAGREIALAPKEYEILLYFLRNPDRVLSRDQVLIHVWGYDYEGSSRTVDTHIKKLRKKLGTAGGCLKTEIKYGYVWKEERSEG